MFPLPSINTTFCVFQEELAQEAVYDTGGHGEGVTDSTTDDNTDSITDDTTDGTPDSDSDRNADQVIVRLCLQLRITSKYVDSRLLWLIKGHILLMFSLIAAIPTAIRTAIPTAISAELPTALPRVLPTLTTRRVLTR